MLVKVTEDDIRKGVYGSAKVCPIALAVKRTLKARFVLALAPTVVADGVYFRLPVEAQMFMENFDNALPVKPFSFEAKKLNSRELRYV